MGKKILLSIVGTGDYREVEYRWNGRSASASLIQQALAEWWPDSEKLFLATPEARDKHGKSLKRIVTVEEDIVDIPNGLNQEEYAEIFNKLVERLPQDAEVVLDITHGFRSLPVLVLLGMSFLRVAKNIQIRHLLYGVYQEDQSEAPVIDLAPFVSMLDWAIATNRFLDTGDAGKLADITGSYSDKLSDGIQSLKAFSRALQLQNPQKAGLAARESVEKLERIEQDLPPPMKILKKRLLDAISPLSFTGQDPQEQQLRALFKHILWYNQHALFEKAVGLASEWIHLFVKWKVRKPMNFSLADELKRHCSEDWAEGLGDLYEEIKHLRNSAAHFHISKNGNSAPIELAPERVKELIDKLKSIVSGAGLNLEPT
ncbi:MAG: TIGR02221 family CRISPR-associated protein [Meiothermus sp.]